VSGPILIFDKSALESLSGDEAVWLDNFFITNITPLFFIEVLADLEKQVRAGRTPEEVVGNLAYKTPDLQSSPNAHHRTLLNGELLGIDTVVMDGRGILTGARPVTLEGSTGLMFPKTPEQEAFERWQRREFLDLERHVARMWQQALSNFNYDKTYHFFQKWYKNGKPKTLADVRALADANIERTDQQAGLRFGMTLLGIPMDRQQEVMTRWQNMGKPPIREFAPYFRYVYSVDLFFYLAIAADLISRVRPAGKADNKVDLAYLYYLPFCKVFTSGDNLHERMVPLFMRENQRFIKAPELKADLRKLDEHYSAHPEDVKIRGLSSFADYPPTDTGFLVTRLWDLYFPNWRLKADKRELSKELQDVLMNLVKKIEHESRAINPERLPTISEADYVQMQRSVMFRKGKWRRFPPEVQQQQKQS
jgi:hypothetical protein